MPFVKEQVSLDYLYSDLLYSLGALAVILVVLALGFIDMGLVRRKNVLDTWVQKLVAALIAGGATLAFGVGIWQWQFNSAFGVPDPLWQALKDWWIGGQFQTTLSGNLDPKVLPEADVLQVFVVFFATFSMGTLALIHSGVMERLKAKPLYTMAFIIGLVLSPLVAYFCWGPLGPLSNNGTHDFEGIFPLYIFSGSWVLILSWRLGPRLGVYSRHPSGTQPAPQNAGLIAVGIILLLFALPFIVLSSTFIIPGTGFFGITFTNSGWGVMLINLFAAYTGGALAGAIIAYRRREPVWALLGPIAGCVMCGTLMDIGVPWEVFLVSLFGPPIAVGTAALMRKWRIDEQKVIPLALGPGVVGALVTGFIEWGTKTGGYPGLEGKFALQHAEITPWMQLAGIAVTMAISMIPCLLICLFFEKTSGLRVSEEEELRGMDQTYWDVDNFGDDVILHPHSDGHAVDPALTPAS